MDLETARKIAELERRLDAIQIPEALGNNNIITIPDNVASALSIVDTGGLEHMRIVSTDTEPTLRFRNTETGSWYDFRLVDATEGDHFRQNAAGFPAGWAQNDAALTTNTTQYFSFWYLRGSSTELSWDYQKQTGIDIEALAANAFAGFQFGPILFRDGRYTADIDYLFAIHGETAAALDVNEYARVHLQWNSAGTQWRVRGESRAGGGDVETASAWTVLDPGPLHQPLYFRVVFRNTAAKRAIEYFGANHIPQTQTLLQSLNETTTWGQVYWRITQSRGAGAEDYLYIGAVDYIAGVP